jgi:predicted nucleotidyltransferase
MLDKGAIVKDVTKYAEAVTKEFSPSYIMLFASYAKGNARDESDIDVAVIFDGFTGNWLDAAARLWRLTEDINYEIEPHLLDITQDKSGFVRHVIKTGEMIYQQA